MADPLAPLAAALRDLAAWLDDAKLPCAVIGGVAASLRGRPRATRDVDCLVLADEDTWQRLVESATKHDIQPRVTDPVAFARESRVLLLRHGPTSVDIDLTLGALLFEEELVLRATRVDVAGVSVPVATAEDLVVMKAIAGRPRDRGDIEGLLDAHPDLDVDRVRKQVAEFAAMLESPEIAADLEALLQGR